jgi:hypothetical protein
VKSKKGVCGARCVCNTCKPTPVHQQSIRVRMDLGFEVKKGQNINQKKNYENPN